MSLLNQLNASTTVNWLNQGTVVDILNTTSPLVWKLMGNAAKKDNWLVQPHETVDGGKMVKVALEYANSNSGDYGADTEIDISKTDIMDAARFSWGGIYASNTKNLDDAVQNSGENAIVHLSKLYIASIKKAARVKLALAVIAAATTSKSINGLGDLFNTNTAVAYGSITEAEMAAWKANVITTDEEISFEVMQKIFRQPNMGDHAESLPNFCVTSQDLRDGFERSLQPQQIYTDTDMVKAGWNNIWHKGAPIVADKAYYGLSRLDALNLNHLTLRAHVKFNFTLPVWEKISVKQPDTLTANTRMVGNLYCDNRQMHVRHDGLKVPS
jgi:hypothetical protein